MKDIFIKENTILLGQFLKFSGVISNGGEAKFFLFENDVFVNGIPENRRGKQLFIGDNIEINGEIFCLRKKENEN